MNSRADRRPNATRPTTDELDASYQVFDRASVGALLSAHPYLRGVLATVRAKITECFGPSAVGLLDAVRAVDGRAPVGVVVVVQGSATSDALVASFHTLLAWWHGGASHKARGRVALGLAPPRQVDNDNALGPAPASAVAPREPADGRDRGAARRSRPIVQSGAHAIERTAPAPGPRSRRAVTAAS